MAQRFIPKHYTQTSHRAKRQAGSHCNKAIATDEVDAYFIAQRQKRVAREERAEARERTKRKAVTLPRAPWE